MEVPLGIPDYIIRAEHITKAFGDKVVLNDVTLNVKPGEFVTILGSSGCGKTTLLRIIAGFETPTEGKILMSGHDITTLPPHKRPMNMVFQRYALFPHLDVYNNIAFGLKLRKMSADEIDKEVMHALKMVGMTDYENRDINSLSGGQQQRVAVARAIVNKPHVLLLDEPLAALDLKMRKDMQMELREMHKNLGITFIYVTHDQEEALALSDTVVVMNDGVIQQIGTPTDIYNEPVNPFVADFIGESNIFNGNMIKDFEVEFMGKRFACVDKGFEPNEPIDVVLRPEDILMDSNPDKGQFRGKVRSCTFLGVHYEMFIDTPDGYEIQVQDYNAYPVGSEVGMSVDPDDIQVMKRDYLYNEFTATVIDSTHICLFGETFETLEHGFEKGEELDVEVDFDKIDLTDNETDGTAAGTIKHILYKGNHFHLTLISEDGTTIIADTNDVWEKADFVGINVNPEDFRLKAKKQ